ncbi:MAG: periplasmic heavy metal sensor [Thermodesulfobacteriota bacterium]
MKKAIAVTALVTVMGLTVISQASAYPGHHGMRGCGGQGGFAGPGMAVMADMDDATKAKLETFLSETQETRKGIRVKQAEKRALMHAETPDAKEVGKLTGEIFDLRNSMRAKAKEAGLEEFMGRGQGNSDYDGRGQRRGGKGSKKGPRMMEGGQGAGRN